MQVRKPTPQELRLIETLVLKANGLRLPQNWQEKLRLSSMNDGAMGSLLLLPDAEHVESEPRMFGKAISEGQFTDSDNIPVIVTLNLDQKGDLFELDIWKTNFNPIITLPD